mmetsp:Transcript_9779/g.17103  ORF Transcript_9779/g.17103 Transcript_9779/m.17103 type:complete len:159 (-) Transcript_9779:75-551(-)
MQSGYLRLFAILALQLLADASLLRSRSRPPVVASRPLAPARGMIGTKSAKLAVNTTANATRHMPKPYSNLVEYKDAAQDCLTWCGSLGSNCFKGCLDECTNHLKPPPCAAFVIDGGACAAECKALEPGYACLKTVTANNTQDCHLKLLNADVKSDCPL